ncbi:MAG TPA: histone deacetylase [Acidimicrobiia bacterium]|nr:histone deacetylase [Acidimicrobiia bacterium]
MDVIVASHPSALLHDTGRRHPERPERVGAVLDGIDASGLDVKRITSPKIERSELALVHDSSYIGMIQTFCELGGGALDMDTFVSRASWEAALAAAGGVRALVEELGGGGPAPGFSVSRPPGHHALRDRAMGFCLFNNVAVSAAYLRSRGDRVAILDWDVHHGNGTQEMVMDDNGILYASIHQNHFYPFAGDLEDIEAGDAKGTTVNVPLPAGTGGDVYRRAWGELILPVLSQFEPDWVLLSAGFDAHTNDHLANFHLLADDYGWMAAELAGIHPAGRIIVALEGGYDLDALRDSTRATLLGLNGRWESDLEPIESPIQSTAAFGEAASVIAAHWSV